MTLKDSRYWAFEALSLMDIKFIWALAWPVVTLANRVETRK
jgi:hypothetical protein